MSEPLSELIRVRVTPDQYQKLSEASLLSGLKLSEYVRRLLISSTTLQSEITQLREAVDALQRSSRTENAVLEILLLLRASLTTDQITRAQQQLNSLGFKTF
ncbi:hypothetical protein [Advenella sp. EE-W14]|uniref:plasmid mobilization protein n=1 Tax=Advenella sp. EE-W14 TaxID=2722705 RepID=UPI00145CA3FC|nr:hypothetical protein [Advenella sp. EE-W14]